ncbi:MAG: division/cell wall cluster transcriptional repressor MraZ [Longimicrobiales bacterium]|nr:division/cell wall cluster transcriptional repressor MraZ [Longimicrobiales bacterium]
MGNATNRHRGAVSTFLGSYTYTLDGKGRVSLPAPFRRDAEDQHFVLLQVYPPSLSLYPERAWREVETRLKNLLRDQPESRKWVMGVLASAVEVSPDSQGRILVPSRLQEAAGLDSQVLMVGMIDKVELWNPSDFEGAVEGKEAEFERYAPQIFR